MNDKLAKKLKDAGFPVVKFGINMVSGQEFIYPSLSDLIEACGKDFKALLRCGCKICKWNCYGMINAPHQDPFDDEDWARPFNGKTPEEAVANLWLALNKK